MVRKVLLIGVLVLFLLVVSKADAAQFTTEMTCPTCSCISGGGQKCTATTTAIGTYARCRCGTMDQAVCDVVNVFGSCNTYVCGYPCTEPSKPRVDVCINVGKCEASCGASSACDGKTPGSAVTGGTCNSNCIFVPSTHTVIVGVSQGSGSVKVYSGTSLLATVTTSSYTMTFNDKQAATFDAEPSSGWKFDYFRYYDGYSWKTTTLDPLDAPGGVTQDFTIYAYFVSTADPCAGHCSNGILDCGEEQTDCGGTCPPCVCGTQGATNSPASRCDPAYYTWAGHSYSSCMSQCSSYGCTDCQFPDYGYGICECTINKDGQQCGTTTCPKDCCLGTTLYNYSLSTFDTAGSCNRLCSGGSCPASCNSCTPTITAKSTDCGYVCTPDWSCTAWSACVSGIQTRTCTDSNNCGTNTGKPAESQTCCTPNWSCTAWGDCIGGTQTRTCTDLNNCGTNTGKPAESQSCTVVTCTDSDNGLNYNTGGTCTDSTSHPDSCSGDVLTEWQCVGTTCSPTTHNCGNDIYSCSVNNPNLIRTVEDFKCSGSPGFCTSSISTTNTWTCDSSKECASQNCEGINYRCYMRNTGNWVWASSLEPTETACDDGFDNDCDNNIDYLDSDCAECTNDDDCPEDVCIESTFNDYSCVEGRCEVQSDDCSDCSCHCGGYDEAENLANENCNDGKDNDCDGLTDSDPECASCSGGTLEDIVVRVDSISDEKKAVTLSYYVIPSTDMIDVEFNPYVITPPNTESLMKITVKPGIPQGLYVIRIVGTASDVTRYTSYTLIVSTEGAGECIGVLSPTISGTSTCTITSTFTATDCNSLDWEIKEGSSIKSSGTVSGNIYSSSPSWTVSTGTYTYDLFIDGNTMDSMTITCSGPSPPPPPPCPGGCDDNNPCTTDTCQSGSCVHTNKPAGSVCGTGSGSCPDKCTNGKEYRGGTGTCNLVCDGAGSCSSTCTPSDCPLSNYPSSGIKTCNFGCKNTVSCWGGVECEQRTATCKNCWWGECTNAVTNDKCWSENGGPKPIPSNKILETTPKCSCIGSSDSYGKVIAYFTTMDCSICSGECSGIFGGPRECNCGGANLCENVGTSKPLTSKPGCWYVHCKSSDVCKYK